MIRKYVWDVAQNKFVERVRSVSEHHFVQSDISEHGGRRAWRDKLKKNGSIEVSAKDMATMKEKWDSRKAEHAAKMRANEKFTRPVDGNVDVMTERPYQMSQTARELANRLDGRPTPDRKMLIKLTLETERMLRGR